MTLIATRTAPSPALLPAAGPEPVIETIGLTKRFGPKLALNQLTLAVPRGGIHAVVGSNGAGKSTLFRLLLGVATPSLGQCRVLGVDSGRLDPATRGRIGLVTEEHTLPGWMTVARLAAMQRSLYPSWSEATFREVAGHFHLHSGQKVSQLSRGERAGFTVALALAQGPELLILDEPTLGLDVVAKQAVLESLLFAGRREDRTLLYCSHQMDEIERLADGLIVLERGELVSHSTPESFWGRIGCWVVAGLVPPEVVVEAIPGLLQRRVVDGREQLVVLDPDPDFGRCLERLGVPGATPLPIGFDRAVNAFLTRNHLSPDGAVAAPRSH
ncbi:MAG TPA: ABC transporter ATP-binding protein [Thermoanaerobaculia bacterium]|nr:ABC transporter ATP-binding protein [Thermoanaerobaculia bacterium]